MLQTIRCNPELVVRVVAARQEDERGVEKRLVWGRKSQLSKTVGDISVIDYIALVVGFHIEIPINSEFSMIATEQCSNMRVRPECQLPCSWAVEYCKACGSDVEMRRFAWQPARLGHGQQLPRLQFVLVLSERS